MRGKAIVPVLIACCGLAPSVSRAGSGACAWENLPNGDWRCDDARIVDVLVTDVPGSVSFQLQPAPAEMCDQSENAYLTYTPPGSVRGQDDRKRNVMNAASALTDALIHKLHVDVIGRTVDADRPGTCEVHRFRLQPAD